MSKTYFFNAGAHTSVQTHPKTKSSCNFLLYLWVSKEIKWVTFSTFLTLPHGNHIGDWHCCSAAGPVCFHKGMMRILEIFHAVKGCDVHVSHVTETGCHCRESRHCLWWVWRTFKCLQIVQSSLLSECAFQGCLWTLTPKYQRRSR